MTAEAFVPLTFAPDEAHQFDGSHEVVLIVGSTVQIRVSHVRFCHRRMLFVRECWRTRWAARAAATKSR